MGEEFNDYGIRRSTRQSTGSSIVEQEFGLTNDQPLHGGYEVNGHKNSG